MAGELEHFRMLIGGKAVDAESEATFESQNPYTGRPWAVVPDGGPADVIARLDGPNAAWPAGLIGMLADEIAAWQALTSPRTIQAPLTALLARHHGLRLAVLLSGGPTSLAPPLRLTPI